jgi:hypothetical protein
MENFFDKGILHSEGKEVTSMKKFIHACNLYVTGSRQFLFAED